jgi:hypothetical protein
VLDLLLTTRGMVSGDSFKNMSSWRALMEKSGAENWYDTFQPRGPNFSRSCRTKETCQMALPCTCFCNTVLNTSWHLSRVASQVLQTVASIMHSLL